MGDIITRAGQMSDKATKEREELTRHILDNVRLNRAAQNKQWGGRLHDLGHNEHDWIAYLVRMLGKMVADGGLPYSPDTFRESAEHVAAVAVAAAEATVRLPSDPPSPYTPPDPPKQ